MSNKWRSLDKNLKRPYSLSKYNPEWKKKFTETKSFLHKVFSNTALGIEHVGSTAIEGMKAKPVIDVLVIVKDIKDITPEQKKEMLKANYVEGENYIGANTLIFYKLSPKGEKLENIHICETGSSFERQFIVMRDYLRSHPEKAKEYADLKEMNASLYPTDYPSYRAAKADFLKSLEKEAYQWNKNSDDHFV